jgi:hypothetical protein
MNEPKLGFFPNIFYSIAGFTNYRYFIRQRTGKAVLYLLLLTLILGVASQIPIANSYNNIINDMIAGFDKSVPGFTFENGKLDVQGEMPILINDGGSTMIIDTSGKTDESILDNYNTAILITSDKMIQKNYVNKQVTDFSMLQGFTMNKDSVKKILPLLKLGAPLIIIFGTIFFICIKFLSALIIGLIGMIINSIKGTHLRFADIFKLSVYSMTLPMLLSALMAMIPYKVPLLWLVFFIIASIYVWGAINVIKNDQEIPPLPPLE